MTYLFIQQAQGLYIEQTPTGKRAFVPNAYTKEEAIRLVLEKFGPASTVPLIPGEIRNALSTLDPKK